MPEISRFYGIVVYMFYNEHAPPHFHFGRRRMERQEVFPGEVQFNLWITTRPVIPHKLRNRIPRIYGPNDMKGEEGLSTVWEVSDLGPEERGSMVPVEQEVVSAGRAITDDREKSMSIQEYFHQQ